MKNEIKIQHKTMKKQKKNFLKLVKNSYTVYDSAFLIDLSIQYIKDLYKYHTDGVNIMCDNTDHLELLQSLTEAYDVAIELEKTFDDLDLDSFKREKELAKKLFDLIGNHIYEWWD